jgi:hypothetical protein
MLYYLDLTFLTMTPHQVPAINESWWRGHAKMTEVAQRDEDSTWYLEGVQQKRGEFRILSESELIDVEELRDLNAKMGAQVHSELSYGCHISVPSTPSRRVFENGNSNVLLSNGSYPSAHEPPNGFKDGVLGTLYSCVLNDIPHGHLWVQDMHKRMKSKGCFHYSRLLYLLQVHRIIIDRQTDI